MRVFFDVHAFGNTQITSEQIEEKWMQPKNVEKYAHLLYNQSEEGIIIKKTFRASAVQVWVQLSITDLNAFRETNYIRNGSLISAQLQEMKRRWTCKVCQKSVVRCAFRPCGHLVTCWDCGQDIEDCFKCGREVGDRIYASKCPAQFR